MATIQAIRPLPKRLASRSSTITIAMVYMVALLVATHVDLSWAYETSINIESFYLPTTMRSEGRITLSYTYGDETKKTQHHFAFSESIDDITKRSRVSIGYISHDPIEYVSLDGAPLVRLDEHGNCIKSEQPNEFVPELNWFAKMIFDETEVNSFFKQNPHEVGPSGFIRISKFLAPDLRFSYADSVMERNIDCALYKAKFTRRRSEEVELNIFIPSKSYFGTSKVPIFTLKEMARHVSGLNESSDTRIYNLAMKIDYFNIQTQDNEQAQSNKMEGDFNLPQARGCSELISNTAPVNLEFSSFIMTYFQRATTTHVTVAYDHENNYLRKEMFGHTISIWDLEDDILYHIDPNLAPKTKMSTTDNREINRKQCAMLRVTDPLLGPAFLPYDKQGSSMSVHQFLGIERMAYIGLGRVRDFPTVIFEGVLKEAPKLFGLDPELIRRADHFIVQYHLINADLKRKYPLSRSIENFWPLRISLIGYDKSTQGYGMIDQLEVDDFHWGLMGWEKKPGELFMASECFDDEYEQVRMELAISFNLRSDLDLKLLAHNKYKLEADLINDIFKTLKVRRIHLVEYELSLRPHNVVLSMVIGDRRDTKALIRYSDNDVPVIESRMDKDSILLSGLVEQDCVSQVSLIKEAQFIVYCPFTQTEQYTCRAYTRDIGFTTTHKRGSGSPLDKCQFYRFDYEPSRASATSAWSQWREMLRNHQFTFNFGAPDESPVSFLGSINDLDITREKQLMKIVNFRFEISSTTGGGEPMDSLKRKLRFFESIQYKSVADCAKICNLDSHCRSYSYCAQMKASTTINSQENNPPNCILASMDLRASKVNEQLINATAIDTIKVVDVTADQYELALDSACNIYERDYLSMFTITDEIVQLDESLVKQLKNEESSFDCAKSGIDLEAGHPEHHVAMFAYCAYSGICLLDENLFSQTNDSSAGDLVASVNAEEYMYMEHELPCNVYRRRYQSYFKVSAHILKPQPLKQVELKFNSVEECARACWNQFGHVCGSFDYCWPSSCYINSVASVDDLELAADELEIRSDCLHYDRDLELDKLRAEHLIGRHNVLEIDHSRGTGLTFARFLVNVLLFCMVSVSFVIGLVIGRVVNDRLETVKIVRQSFSAGSGGLRRVSRAFGATFARFGGFGAGIGGFDGPTSLSSGHRKFYSSEDMMANNDDGHGYDGSSGLPSAIQLEEFRSSMIREEDEKIEEHSDRQHSSGGSERAQNADSTSIDLQLTGEPVGQLDEIVTPNNGLEIHADTLLQL